MLFVINYIWNNNRFNFFFFNTTYTQFERKKNFFFERNYEIRNAKRKRKNLIELIIQDMFVAFGFRSTMEKSKHFIGLHSRSTKKIRPSPFFLPPIYNFTLSFFQRDTRLTFPASCFATPRPCIHNKARVI